MDFLSLHPPTSENSPALIEAETGHTWTYAQLALEVERQASQLRTNERKLIFLFCKNEVASVITYLSCLSANQPVCLLDAAMSQEAKDRLIHSYRPSWIFGIESPSIKQEGTVKIHESLSVLLPTSGSTGNPKLVRLSTGNLLANARSITSFLKLSPQEKALLTLPLHYSYGLSILNSHLYAGACIVLTKTNLLTPNFQATLEKYQCTSFANVPYGYQILDRIGGLDKLPSTIRTFTQAGGKLSQELITKFDIAARKRNGQFIVMYGQTEATARMTYLPPQLNGTKLGSVGIAIPGGHIEIRNAHGKANTRESGEVYYIGENVMLGYAESLADLTIGDVLQRTLATGDIGYLDEEGFLFLHGRSKRIAKIFGTRINLDDVEAALKHSGPVAALSAQDHILICCEWGDEACFRTESLRLSEKYRMHHNSFRFRKLETLPTTTAGKIDYEGLLKITL